MGPPVEGRWLILNPPGHARWAFDLVAVDERSGRCATRRLTALLAGLAVVDDVHGWSQPVLAPHDGVVITAHDGERDRRRLVPLVDLPAAFLLRPILHRTRVEKMAGNHVVLSTRAGYIFLAHLQQGSIRVRPGDHVHAGQRIALVGNSGNSVAPHLHLQVMDAADPTAASVVPFHLQRFRVLADVGAHTMVDAPLPDRSATVDFVAEPD